MDVFLSVQQWSSSINTRKIVEMYLDLVEKVLVLSTLKLVNFRLYYTSLNFLGILLHDDSADVNGMPYKVVCPENDEVAWYYATEIVISGSSTLTCLKDDQEGKTQDEDRDEVSLRADPLESEVSENDDQAEGKANAGEESENGSGESDNTDVRGAEEVSPKGRIMSSIRVHPSR